MTAAERKDTDLDARLAEAVRRRECGRLEDALELMLELTGEHPDNGVVAYQTAWIHDRMGLEREALPYYRKALDSGALNREERLGALTGCGSTLRILGSHPEAVDMLRTAVAEYPQDGGAKAFLAMALYNTGAYHEAMSLLLRLLASSSTAEGVATYRKAIEYYAENLDAIEGG